MRTYRITGEKEHRLLIHRAIKFCQNLEDGKLTTMADIIPMSDEAFSELHDIEVMYARPSINRVYDTVDVKYHKVDENEYQMICDERSLGLISGTCDLISRIHMCQFNEIAGFISVGEDPTFKKLHELRDKLDQFKRFFGLTSLGNYYGIYSHKISDDARSYWDMNQVMRNRLAYDHNPGITPENRWEKGKITHDFDEPTHSNKNLSLIKIEVL